jgi:hypothetical protein
LQQQSFCTGACQTQSCCRLRCRAAEEGYLKADILTSTSSHAALSCCSPTHPSCAVFTSCREAERGQVVADIPCLKVALAPPLVAANPITQTVLFLHVLSLHVLPLQGSRAWPSSSTTSCALTSTHTVPCCWKVAHQTVLFPCPVCSGKQSVVK